MKKKSVTLFLLFFIFISGLSCNNKRIHLKAFVPETININTTLDNKINIIFNEDRAYYNFSDLNGFTTNYLNASYFNIYMI